MSASEGRLALRWIWPAVRTSDLQGARLTLGRDDAAAIRLTGAGVSRFHAELYRQGPLYVLRDLGSTNGTWLDGRTVEHAPVLKGQVLRLGDHIGVVVDASAPSKDAFGEVARGVWGGAELAACFAPLEHAARSSLPLVFIGGTGTGKERFARAAHDLSGRPGPFVAINCGALPEQLAEAELFGYRKGAFTGAERASAGYFRASHRGTLFLDEMPELSPTLQAKLLRVLDDGRVTGLGETSGSVVDTRIVSASQKSLRELVASGRLRQDLAARLGGLEVAIPPLAARRGDVPPLFMHFLHMYSGGRAPQAEARLIEALCLHDWPENVRELEMSTRRLLAIHGHEPVLRRRHLPPHLAELVAPALALGSGTSVKSRRDHDLGRLKHELAANGGNIKAAAQTLKISRQRVYRLLEDAERPLGESLVNVEHN